MSTQTPSEPEVLIDPRAFQNGQRKALAALSLALDALPEQLASPTRDEGRGATYAVEQVRSLLRHHGLRV